MQTATDAATAGFADLICSDSEWLDAEFAALVARSRLEPPVRVGASGPRSSTSARRHRPTHRPPRSAPDTRIRAVARCPPTRNRHAGNRTPR